MGIVYRYNQSMFNNLRQQLARLITPSKNSMSIPQHFLRYGNERMHSDWTEVSMSDRDLYTGYAYATIRNRANAVARMATENIYTKTEEKKQDNEKEIVHPYLDVISSSPSFSNYQFWHNISVYLDLEGVYYLMAIRAFDGDRKGTVKEFKMLNPYNIRRVIDKPSLEEGVIKVSGYIESRLGLTREIPREMIIEIRDLNPFDEEAPYSMTDAAKESQFTLKTAGDFTRHALKNNINTPGIISTDVLLNDEDFKNFKARMIGHVKGEPVFGNGAGSVKWDPMSANLKDSALDKIEEMNRSSLFAVAGMSKTMMGIEESGTTRETGRVQKDLFIEGHILPRVQLIIDGLNQDYRNNSPQITKTAATIAVNNPNATDHDAELVETEVKQKTIDLYNSLIDKGYDEKTASQYVMGEIEIDQLGKPKNPPVPTVVPGAVPVAPVAAKVKPKNDVEIDSTQHEVIEKQVNAVDEHSQGIVRQQEGFLQNAIVNVEEQMVMMAINRVTKKTAKNQFEDEFIAENDVITKTEKKESLNELVLILTAFYGVIMNLEGGQTMRDRQGEFALPGDFSFNKDIQKYIKEIALKASESHVDTIAADLFEQVRQDALKGLGQQQIISNIRNKYAKDIVEKRAKAIARTESNRAFTRAQYEADGQFIEQNHLEDRAYKKWRTRSANPCAFCQQLASEPPIPFKQDFRSLGKDVTSGEKTLKVAFESLKAGNAHTNCSCEHELIIISAAQNIEEMAAEFKHGLADVKKIKEEISEYVDELFKVI